MRAMRNWAAIVMIVMAVLLAVLPILGLVTAVALFCTAQFIRSGGR